MSNLASILFPYREYKIIDDPDGDICIANNLFYNLVNICNLEFIIKENGLENYSFWLCCCNIDSYVVLKYLKNNNIKYCSFTDNTGKVLTNPDLILLEEQLHTKDHRIKHTRDINSFTIYDNDKVLLDSRWNDILQRFISIYLEDTLISILESTERYNHGSEISIYECDIPLFIRWLRDKYTFKTKSANKV